MSRRVEQTHPILRNHQRYGAIEGQDSVESGRGLGDDVTGGVAIFPSYRLLVALVAQLGLLCSFASQSIMGASLLTMVTNNVNNATNATTTESQWHYAWDPKTQTWILAAFFCGYYVVQIPAGLVTHRVGGKRLALFGAIGLALLQGVSVYVPRFGPAFFLVTMVMSGITNGCLYVPLMDVLARWVPPQESSTLVNLAVSGIGIGIAFVYGLSAFTSQVHLYGGWPFNFIALGGLLLVFAVLLWVLVSDRPESCAYLSARELRYILTSMALHGPANKGGSTTQCCAVPWRQIVTSGPVVAISASQFGTDWMQYFFITLFPLYLKHVRGMPTGAADMLAGLPWLGFPVFGFLVSRVVDRVRERRLVSTTVLRKAVDGMAKVVPMCMLVGMMYLPEGQDVALGVLYVLCIVLISLEGSSWVANIVDVTSQYAGFVSSVAQVLSLPGSILLPILVQVMTPHNTSEEWQRCILAMLAIVTSSYLVYVMLGSSEPQTWKAKSAKPLVSSDSSHKDSSDEVEYITSCQG